MLPLMHRRQFSSTQLTANAFIHIEKYSIISHPSMHMNSGNAITDGMFITSL